MPQSDSEKLKQVLALDSELHKIQDLDILLERILYEARKVVNADAGSIYIKEGDHLIIQYSQNDTIQKTLPPGQKLIYNVFKVKINPQTISGYVASTGSAVNIPNVYNIPEGAPYSFDPSYDQISGYRTVSNLTVPIRTNLGEMLGVLQMINAKDPEGNVAPFTKEDEMLVLHFATNVSTALQRAQMTRAILLRMIRMAELRDPKETGPHVNRVAGYAVEIYERWAQKHHISQHEIEQNRDNLRMAAMLHDVGKVAISDIILKKPARFTDEEYEIMKSHTYMGARLFIDKQSEFDEMAQLVALTHHENWDGSGYPGHIEVDTADPLHLMQQKTESNGLKGEEIPLFGRIVALADVYDALISHRVYKEAWSEEKVYKEIRTLAGTKFDPELVDIFFEVLPNIKSVASKYPDQESN
ncbi:MAG: HD domain-containing protein [Spirochaetales bacterium]|nr:HD domain-containing protein [Spirochaetales bacterium]